MPGIPFRGQAPAFRPPAPRPVPAPFPGAPGAGLPGYTPKKIGLPFQGSRLGRVLLNPRNLRGASLGGFIASVALEWAVSRAQALAILWLNGLTVVRVCDPSKGMDTFTVSAALNACLTGTGGGLRLSQLGQRVAIAAPTDYFPMLGISAITPFGAVFYKESRTYGIVPVPVGQTRPRPFYSPATFPFAPPRISALSRPRYVPYNVRPWPVWAGPVPPGTGVSGGYAPPGAAVGGRGYGDIPMDGQWTWPARPGAPARPQTPARPVARAVPMPGTKEMKMGANTAAGQMFFALMKAKEYVSEVDDFVTAIFKALPKSIQKQYGKDLGSMSVAVWKHFDDMDFRLMFRNLLANHLEDEIIGRSYFGARGLTRNAAFGNRMGSTGPVANPFFEDFAKRVNAFADATVNPFFGYGAKAEHWRDRASRLAREKRRKEQLRRLRARPGRWQDGKGVI